MLNGREKASQQVVGAQEKKEYTKPSLVSRGNILTLTQGGGLAPGDAQGTNLLPGAES